MHIYTCEYMLYLLCVGYICYILCRLYAHKYMSTFIYTHIYTYTPVHVQVWYMHVSKYAYTQKLSISFFIPMYSLLVFNF